MPENPEEHQFRSPEALLAVVQARGADIARPRDTRPASNAEVELGARTYHMSIEEYWRNLVRQRAESQAFSIHLMQVGSKDDINVAAQALRTWIGTSLRPPVYITPHAIRIDTRGIAESLIIGAAEVIEKDPSHVDDIAAYVAPFFDLKHEHANHKNLANMFHTVASGYTTALGVAKMGYPPYERGAMAIFSGATDEGYIPGDFWYKRCVITANGMLRFAAAEGLYDQLMIRGNDINPQSLTNEKAWTDLTNYSLEIFRSLLHDDTRNHHNVNTIIRYVEGQRGRGSKELPPSAFIQLANQVTNRLNETPHGFGADFDDQPEGQRALLGGDTMHNLGNAIHRLLYITRTQGGEDLTGWQRYQDAIYSGTVEGLVTNMQFLVRRRKLGAAAASQSTSMPQAMLEQARNATRRPHRIDWYIHKPGRPMS